MDAECYFAEYMMRERLADVQASAELARLLRQSNEHSGRHGAGGRFILGLTTIRNAVNSLWHHAAIGE
jgi:hypothetical protein